MAKKETERMRLLKIAAAELNDVVAECDAAITAAETRTVTVLIETDGHGNEDTEYFVPKEYIIAAFQKWREDTCLRHQAIYQKLEGLA